MTGPDAFSLTTRFSAYRKKFHAFCKLLEQAAKGRSREISIEWDRRSNEAWVTILDTTLVVRFLLWKPDEAKCCLLHLVSETNETETIVHEWYVDDRGNVFENLADESTSHNLEQPDFPRHFLDRAAAACLELADALHEAHVAAPKPWGRSKVPE